MRHVAPDHQAGAYPGLSRSISTLLLENLKPRSWYISKPSFEIFPSPTHLSNLSKGNHDFESVQISDNRFLRFYFSIFYVVLVWIIYQTLKTVFNHISKHLKVWQKYSTTHCIFNSLYSVFENKVLNHALQHYTFSQGHL